MNDAGASQRKSWAGIVRPAGGTDLPPLSPPINTIAEDGIATLAVSDDGYRAWRTDPLKDRQYLLEVRHRDPTVHVEIVDLYPYALLTHVRLMAGTMLTLDFSGTLVVIEGRFLDQMIPALKQSIVTQIEGWSRVHHREPESNSPKISRIEIIDSSAHKQIERNR